MKFLSPLRLCFISVNLPYSHIWNAVVMSGLALLVTAWNCLINYKNGYAGLLVLQIAARNCWISYKNGYAVLLVLHLLPLLNAWFIIEM